MDYLRAALEYPGLDYAEAPAPLSGGFDTEIFTFRLNGAPATLSGPLVLRVTDPACDVAATTVILEQAPLAILPVSLPVRWAMAAARRVLVTLYLRGYRRQRPLDPHALAYGEALACMRGLVRAAEHRASAGTATNQLDASTFGARLAARFVTLTGIRIGGMP
jgi:hypothetical protein